MKILQDVAKSKVARRFKSEGDEVIYTTDKKRCRYSLEARFHESYLNFERINWESGLRNQLALIENKRFFIRKSTTNGRINHNLTSLDSKILTHLKLDGEELSEIDLANSQPLLLANLIMKSLQHIHKS